jgi:hypothetical protein
MTPTEIHCTLHGATHYSDDGEEVLRQWNPLTGLTWYKGPIESREGWAKALGAAWAAFYLEECDEA